MLVLATEVVPLPGLPTNGGGLRGWTLARGLEAAGLDVTLVFPREPLDALAPDLAPDVVAAAALLTFSWTDPGAAIRQHRPDAVVCCSWFLAARLGSCPVPLAVDLAGPVLLEFLYQDRAKAREYAPLKPRGLALADFVTCAGERQRAYFYPWLTLAGFDQDDLTTRVATVPISTAPDNASPLAAPQNAEPSIICAGVVLPWQDPLVPLRATLETLERRECGHLDLFLYTHQEHSRGARWIEWVREEAQRRPRLRLRPERQRPYTTLLNHYRHADLAFDLFAHNPERELAFNTRTVDYLACGLPPLYSDYAELAGPITRYDAGFVVDPGDAAAVKAAVTVALGDPARLTARRGNARRLVDDLLTWDRTITPLARWCAHPTRRVRHSDALNISALAPDQATAEHALLAAQEESATWRGVAEERETYARQVEAAWQERGEALAARAAEVATWQGAPWRTALRHSFGGPLARLRGRGGPR